ncbi:TAXI family TRAP transporter solute-binding subunit [Heliorestis acidaminivorans]|uniref:TAXI family TRAP transporter solute-binding subunit n=1 Tax=Heliorestis acidaminivorans TaxID=553427 RepID=A0A6I0F6I4_9FIRM|nr:TAXI family TRAP transporter solute-binding subunit [Heliorestis acidaminivorans]KAB2952972.1 TAXI family TRAP transporter solute-binding subunit [Heliorestis acidaminivorans]
MFKKSKLLSISALLIAFSFLLTACGAQTGKDYTILTGGEQGTYYPLGSALAQVISRNVDDVSATAVVTGASVVNVNQLKDKKGQLAFVQNDIAYYATEGLVQFNEKIGSFSAIASLYPEVVHIVTAADSGIVSVNDLRGKRVAVGDQGSGVEANTKQILEVHGLTYDDIRVEYMAFGDAANGIQDGNIDAAFVTAGTPTGAIEALKAVKPVRIVSISADKIQELTALYPYYTSFTLTKDIYDRDEEATTVAVQAMLVVSDEVSDDDVYNITKALFDNLELFGNTHQRGKDISLDSALDGLSVKIHPGAQRYYDEVLN